MPNPQPKSYSCESGGSIEGGKSAPTFAWLDAMTGGTWRAHASTLDSIDPESNDAINPNHPGNAPWHGIGGMPAIIAAWNGAVWDDVKGDFILPIQGGHEDTADNAPYRKRYKVEVPTWEMMRNPTGAIGNEGELDDGLEATGVYFDGRPRSVHSYNNACYIPGDNPHKRIFIPVLVGAFSAGQVADRVSKWLSEVDWEFTNISGSIQHTDGFHHGGCCYDSLRHRVWYVPSTNSNLRYFDVASEVWTNMSGTTQQNSNYKNPIYIPSLDLIFVIGGGGAGWYVVDPANGAVYQPGASGSAISGFSLQGGAAGGDWCEPEGAICMWNHTDNNAQIVTLTPTGNPKMAPWAYGTLTVDGDNAVTPTDQTTWGTYGRFKYGASLDSFFLLNAADEPSFSFKRAA